MLSEQLVNMVEEIRRKKCEMQNIELKTAKKGAPERLYDTLSSFSNQDGGGIIIFGISEKEDYRITGVYDAQDIQTKVTNQALQMEPVVRPVFTVAEMDGNTIVSAEISECEIYDKPCFYKGAGRLRGSFVRVGESDQPMTEYEIYSYEAFKRKIEDELRNVDRSDMSSFDEGSVAEYLINLKKCKPNLANQNKEKILSLQGFTNNEKPTVAGIMLLGEYPQAYFPQLGVTAMVVAGTEFAQLGARGERFIDNQRIEGRIPQMLTDTLAFIRRNSRVATIINDEGARIDRPEYPMKAVREIILNALVHRDYSIHTDQSPIRVILYEDRLEVENPGGLYGRLTIDNLGKAAADTRNPFIAGALEIMGETENRYSGIPTIRDEMKAAGLTPAVFESRRGYFRVTLFNKLMDQASISTKKSAGNIDDKIISFCNVPRSREDIAKHLGIGSTYYVASKYIRPLVDSGKLGMTLPRTPRSKSQKYFTASDNKAVIME